MDYSFADLYNLPVAAIAVLLFVLVSVAIKSARSGLARFMLIALTTIVLAAVVIGPFQLLSYAKPTTMEWIERDVPEAKVVYAELRENVGIFLLLDWEGESRWYRIAWSEELARQLIAAMQEAGGEGPQSEGGGMTAGEGTVMMRDPFGKESELEANPGEGEEDPYAIWTGNYQDRDDVEMPQMFYAAPQPGFPPKDVPVDSGPLIQEGDFSSAPEVQNYQLPQEQAPVYYDQGAEHDGF